MRYNECASSIIVISLLSFKKVLLSFQIGSITTALNLQLPIYANYLSKKIIGKEGFALFYEQQFCALLFEIGIFCHLY